MKVSVIIPACNEAEVIKRNITVISSYLRKILADYEIIIAEDGSIDGTDRLALEIANKNPSVMLLHLHQKLGKGLALKKAIRASKSEIIVFMDADLATSLEHLPQLIRPIEKGYDIAIGSRHVMGSDVKRPIARAIASLVYNLFINLLFKDGIHDHQCGFKAFSRQALKSIINDVRSDGFFFDTELIIKARQQGLSIVEIPVSWKERKRESTLRKILELAPPMAWGLLRLKLSSLTNLGS